MAEAKICGVTDASAADAALDGGARFIGLVFFPGSPRHLSFGTAASLASRVRGRVDTVAVTVDASDALLEHIASAVQPDWIQAHGHEPPSRVAALRRFAGKGVIKALGVARAEDLAPAAQFAAACEMFLFDAKAPAGADRPGGNAAAFDWKIMAGQRFSRPWLLSGGLGPGNVLEAIAASGAALVDVSSGVESAPGLKDPGLIAQFLAASRN
jgi:phosphoribosylanthranilate isomerase